jgi:hypothetical protein
MGDKITQVSDNKGDTGKSVTKRKKSVTTKDDDYAKWAKINERCQACTRPCKQSAMVILVKCLQFTPKVM